MELKLDRAGKLVSGLAGERVRWEKTVEVHTHTSMHTHAYARRHAHLMKPGNTTDCVFFLNAGSGDGHGLSSGRLSTGCCVSLIHGSFSVQLQRRAAHKDLDKTGYSSSPYNRNIFHITVVLYLTLLSLYSHSICSSRSWRFHALQASVLLFSSPKPQPCVTGTSRVFPPTLSPLRMELSSPAATGQPSPD